MKKFLLKLLWLALPVVLLAYPADWFLSQNLKISNNYGGEYPIWNAIFDGKLNARTYIYGSSRAWVHIDPEVIGKKGKTTAYNMGVDGHNFRLQYLRHQLALKYNPKPEVIIHSVDFFTWSKQPDLYNAEQFLPYMLNSKDLKAPLFAYNGFRPVDFELPLFRYYGKFPAVKEAVGQALGIDPNVPVRIKGFEAQDKVWNGEFDRVKDKLKAINIPVDPKMVRLFDNYLTECAKKNIRVVLVYTPEYIEGQRFVKNRDAIVALQKKMAEKHHIPYLDYSKSPLSYNKKYFYNALHLNKTGVKLFNIELANDLQELGILAK